MGRGITVLHLNVRGLRRTSEFCEIKEIIQRQSLSSDILVFSESWVPRDSGSAIYNTEGYGHLRFGREIHLREGASGLTFATSMQSKS